MFGLFYPLRFGPVGQSIPAAVSLAYLTKLWWAGELYGLQQAGFVAWFIAAFAIQMASSSPGMWIAGFVGQAALAVLLVLKDHVDGIF